MQHIYLANANMRLLDRWLFSNPPESETARQCLFRLGDTTRHRLRHLVTSSGLGSFADISSPLSTNESHLYLLYRLALLISRTFGSIISDLCLVTLTLTPVWFNLRLVSHSRTVSGTLLMFKSQISILLLLVSAVKCCRHSITICTHLRLYWSGSGSKCSVVGFSRANSTIQPSTPNVPCCMFTQFPWNWWRSIRTVQSTARDGLH